MLLILPNLSKGIKSLTYASYLSHTRYLHITGYRSKDYYKILAISSNASQAEVKKAYYQQAKKHHPDRNPGDHRAESLFQKISEAYEVLGDEFKRKEYDKNFSHKQSKTSPYKKGTGKKETPSKSYTWNYNLETDPLELFRKVFGDLEDDFKFAAEDQSSFGDNNLPRAFVAISLKESATGLSRCINFLSSEDKIKFHGKEILVDIPPGIEDGQTLWLKLDSEQEAIVQIKVDEKFGFTRKNNDIYSDLNVSILDATLGNIVSVEGLHKTLKVKLPTKLSSHSVLKIPNQGFHVPKSSGEFGHHYIRVHLDINQDLSLPKNETEDQASN